MSDETPKPTTAEAMFFYSIFKNTRSKVDVDWALVAAEQGLKNADVAKVRFGQIKRKLGIAASGDSPSSAKKTPSKITKSTSTPTKRKPKAKAKNEAENLQLQEEREDTIDFMDEDEDTKNFLKEEMFQT